MAPYFMSLGEHVDMSQATNDLFSDDEDDLFDEMPSLTITPVPIPHVLPADNTLPQLLAQSCGTEDFRDVTSIQLKVIASQTSLQRLHIYLPRLVELDLTGSHLLSLRPLGFGLDSLCVLRVGRCSLSCLDGLFGVSGLRELYAPHNTVSELGLLATLPFLRVLDLRSNQVSSLLQVGFLSLCKELRELTLAECPVSQLPGYKASVVTTMPRLSQLDGLLLAEGGGDLCAEGRRQSPDPSDGEDGATALSLLTPERRGVEVEQRTRRPATVGGPRTVRAPHILPPRPATATATNGPQPLVTAPSEAEAVSDAVSKLTSGGVVCGNLAAALRGKHRQRKPAWPTQETEKDKVACRNGLNVSQLYSETENVQNGGGDTCQPLLLASRQWRQAYHSFRTAHREQWKREEEEEGAQF